MAKINYIENNKNNGIEVNWKDVRKEFNKLDIPPEIWNPFQTHFWQNPWNIYLSQRSVGKTTQFLLVGMLLHKMYDCKLIYLRDHEKECSRKNLLDLFNVIKQFNYVEKITDGKYNSVDYYANRWFYVHLDEDGEIDMKSEPFMVCLTIDKNEIYKSTFNSPSTVMIIYDEFIKKYYPFNEFVYFMDLHKTIVRGRKNVITVLLANTIDTESEWFHEFDIYDDISDIKKGQTRTVVGVNGTRVGVTYVDVTPTTKKKNDFLNSLYYGFNNKKLGSITGYGWSEDSYPHIERNMNVLESSHRYKIEYLNSYVELELANIENYGLMLIAHYSTKIYDDSIIYTKGFLKDSRYRFYTGFTEEDKRLWNLVKNKRILYQNNRVGRIIEKYLIEK